MFSSFVCLASTALIRDHHRFSNCLDSLNMSLPKCPVSGSKSTTFPKTKHTNVTRQSASVNNICRKLNAVQPRFITNPKNTLYSSVLSKGPRNNPLRSEFFSYDLSPGEIHFAKLNNQQAMKCVPEMERKLLQSGERNAYLERRYDHIPEHKYNFPEATSWRIGWMHNDKLRAMHR